MTEHPLSELDKPAIRRFAIRGLFGEKDFDITFDSAVTVLIADNGSGKTTILSMIYAVLSRQLHRLRKYEFKTIEVETQSGEQLTIAADSIYQDFEWVRSLWCA